MGEVGVNPFRRAMMDHLVVYVSDLAAAREFYERTIGCEYVDETEDARGWTMTLAHSGGQHIRLRRMREQQPQTGLSHVAYRVSDIEFNELVADLERRGVRRCGPLQEGKERSISFRDPDGVLWECVCR